MALREGWKHWHAFPLTWTDIPDSERVMYDEMLAELHGILGRYFSVLISISIEGEQRTLALMTGKLRLGLSTEFEHRL